MNMNIRLHRCHHTPYPSCLLRCNAGQSCLLVQVRFIMGNVLWLHRRTKCNFEAKLLVQIVLDGDCEIPVFDVTFTFSHLADAFIQSDLHMCDLQCIHILHTHCTSGAIRGSVSCSRTLRQGIELATLWLLTDLSTSCTIVAPTRGKRQDGKRVCKHQATLSSHFPFAVAHSSQGKGHLIGHHSCLLWTPTTI